MSHLCILVQRYGAYFDLGVADCAECASWCFVNSDDAGFDRPADYPATDRQLSGAVYDKFCFELDDVMCIFAPGYLQYSTTSL